MCRRHCVEAGGCQGAKTHATSTRATPTLTSDKGKQAVASSSAITLSPSSSPPPSWDKAITRKSTAVDMFANPIFASQMTAAFTKQHAVEQAQEEQLQAADAECLSNIAKAKNHVIIYAWPKVSCSSILMLQVITSDTFSIGQC